MATTSIQFSVKNEAGLTLLKCTGVLCSEQKQDSLCDERRGEEVMELHL